MWDLKEERLEQRLQALAQQGDWDGVVQALDDYDKNNDRRHEDRRDDFDLSLSLIHIAFLSWACAMATGLSGPFSAGCGGGGIPNSEHFRAGKPVRKFF